jgi:DNA modification methylase
LKPYYSRAGVTIYLGDCRKLLSGIKADVLITDPPYGVNLGEHSGAKEKRGFLKKAKYASYEDSRENFLKIVVPSVIKALNLTKRGVVFCAGTMMWDFPTPAAVGGVFIPAACGRNVWGFSSLAHCLFYGKAPNLHKGSKPICINSNESAEITGHPCSKPLGWMKWLVGLASIEGEIVLDPFMGSGTTLLAARLKQRKAIGIEIEERYCELAAKRLERADTGFTRKNTHPDTWTKTKTLFGEDVWV